MRKSIQTGVSSFDGIISNNYYYVDKTELIKGLIEKPLMAHLFTRPRRFGKTLAMSMIDCFFNMKYKGNTWFDGLMISDYRECDIHKNAYPVISISMKDLYKVDLETTKSKLLSIISTLFSTEFPYLKDSDRIGTYYRDYSVRAEMRRLDYSESLDFLKNLSDMLYLHHGIRPIILVDEYDAPIMNSHDTWYASDILTMVRDILSQALKDSKSLHLSVVTGVMQIAKESIFSGLNNLEVHNIFGKNFDESFGFTNSDVERICEYFGRTDKYAEAREWYDGYLFGKKEIYNPLSILKYVSESFTPYRYWAGTSGNDIIGTMLNSSGDDIQNDLKSLSEGNEISRLVKPEIAMDELSNPDNIFSVMVMSGYLKARKDEGIHLLSIPNKEMYEVFGNTILEPAIGNYDEASRFMKSMTAGNANAMKDSLSNLFKEHIGFPMLVNEHVYQAFILGIVLRHGGGYESKSEFESGNGRYDTVLKSLDSRHPNIIMEFKRHYSNVSEETAIASAKSALRQIHDKEYHHGLKGDTILYGIAFAGKIPYIESERMTL